MRPGTPGSVKHAIASRRLGDAVAPSPPARVTHAKASLDREFTPNRRYTGAADRARRLPARAARAQTETAADQGRP
jgi:hypothetical protein